MFWQFARREKHTAAILTARELVCGGKGRRGEASMCRGGLGQGEFESERIGCGRHVMTRHPTGHGNARIGIAPGHDYMLN